MDDDKTLLKEFVRNESQAAFETLVSRYTSLVYNSAQRRVGADHDALPSSSRDERALKEV